MTVIRFTGDALWERMDRAVKKVRQRLERAARALQGAGVPYAIIGGNAVRAWVAQADEAAVRNTRDVDILLRRSDLAAATAALAQAGFIHRHVKGIEACRAARAQGGEHLFLDGPGSKARDAVHVIFAAEKVREDDLVPAPDVTESESLEGFRVVSLEPLARMKLTSFRDKDRMHLRDMVDVGLLDESWCARIPAELAARLAELLANPNG